MAELLRYNIALFCRRSISHLVALDPQITVQRSLANTKVGTHLVHVGLAIFIQMERASTYVFVVVLHSEYQTGLLYLYVSSSFYSS